MLAFLVSRVHTEYRWYILWSMCVFLHRCIIRLIFFEKLGMGLGGPVGGLITDWWFRITFIPNLGLKYDQAWLAMGIPNSNPLICGLH